MHATDGAAAGPQPLQAYSPATGLVQGAIPDRGRAWSRSTSGASARGDAESVGAEEVRSRAQRTIQEADARGTLSLRSTVFAAPPPAPPAQPELQQVTLRQLMDEDKAWKRDNDLASRPSATPWVPPHEDHPTPTFVDERKLSNPVSSVAAGDRRFRVMGTGDRFPHRNYSPSPGPAARNSPDALPPSIHSVRSTSFSTSGLAFEERQRATEAMQRREEAAHRTAVRLRALPEAQAMEAYYRTARRAATAGPRTWCTLSKRGSRAGRGRSQQRPAPRLASPPRSSAAEGPSPSPISAAGARTGSRRRRSMLNPNWPQYAVPSPRKGGRGRAGSGTSMLHAGPQGEGEELLRQTQMPPHAHPRTVVQGGRLQWPSAPGLDSAGPGACENGMEVANPEPAAARARRPAATVVGREQRFAHTYVPGGKAGAPRALLRARQTPSPGPGHYAAHVPAPKPAPAPLPSQQAGHSPGSSAPEDGPPLAWRSLPPGPERRRARQEWYRAHELRMRTGNRARGKDGELLPAAEYALPSRITWQVPDRTREGRLLTVRTSKIASPGPGAHSVPPMREMEDGLRKALSRKKFFGSASRLPQSGRYYDVLQKGIMMRFKHNQLVGPGSYDIK